MKVRILSQEIFDSGTVELKIPGTYVLSEDIVFDPKKEPEKRDHDPFTLGWFAAIRITGKNITLDLNGHTLRQSLSHSLRQRFYANIELAGSPFIDGQGPAEFGKVLDTCTNVCIRNGTIGLSSHHSIHGNSAKKVMLENLVCFDFELAAIALNGCRDVTIRKVDINQSFAGVKVNSAYSHAVFIQKYLDILAKKDPSASITLEGHDKNVLQIRSDLSQSIKEAFDNVMNSENVSNPLFKNDSKLLDGASYGIVLNTVGVVVNDFLLAHKGGSGNENIVIHDVFINNIRSAPREYKTLAIDTTGTQASIIKDAVGGTIDFETIQNEDGSFKSNVLVDAQLIVAKHLPNIGKTVVPEKVLDWAAGYNKQGLDLLHVVHGRDSMQHVMKGNIGLFLSSTTNAKIWNLDVNGLENASGVSNDSVANSASGVAIVSCDRLNMFRSRIHNIKSSGNANGIFLVGSTTNCYVEADISDVTTTNNYCIDNDCKAERVRADPTYTQRNVNIFYT